MNRIFPFYVMVLYTDNDPNFYEITKRINTIKQELVIPNSQEINSKEIQASEISTTTTSKASITTESIITTELLIATEIPTAEILVTTETPTTTKEMLKTTDISIIPITTETKQHDVKETPVQDNIKYSFIEEKKKPTNPTSRPVIKNLNIK
ncbi:hypothetical protein ACTFIV_006430 [Dictyostelium citrinum]